MRFVKFALKTTQGIIQVSVATVLLTISFLLLASTIARYLEDNNYRAAAAAVARGEWGEAKRLLVELGASRPNDATIRVLLGHMTLAKVQPDKEPQGAINQAISYYKEALEKEPGRPSAAIGLAVAHLRLADFSPATERQGQIEEAQRALDQASTADDNLAADVQCCRAAIAMASGNWKDAAPLLDEVKNKGLPARASVGTYYWHKALLGVAARDPGAIDNLRRTFLFLNPPEPGSDVSKALALALRMACADQTYPNKDGFDLAARTKLAWLLANHRISVGSQRNVPRFGMTETDRCSVSNAIGMGLVQTNQLEEAAKAFGGAFSRNAQDGLFHMNRGETLRMLAEDKDAKIHPWADAGGEFENAANRLGDDPARAPLRAMLYRNASICRLLGGQNAMLAIDPLGIALKAGLITEKEYERDVAVILDRGRELGASLEHYEKAKKLGHPESFKIEVRVERIKQLLGKR